MSKSCKGLAAELVKCVADSVCVKEEKRSIKECTGEKPPKVPQACVGIRDLYARCKFGQLDMRTRIPGNKGY